MESIDYSKYRQITLKGDLPVKFLERGQFGDKALNNVFEKNNIFTLEDLFIAYDKGLFNDKRKRFNTQIKGQIDFLRAYYIGAPLMVDDILELEVDANSIDGINKLWEDIEIVNGLERIGLSGSERQVIYYYAMKALEDKSIHIGKNKDGHTTYIMLIRSFLRNTDYQKEIIEEYDNPSMKSNRINSINNLKFKLQFYEEYLKFQQELSAGVPEFQKGVNSLAEIRVIKRLELEMKSLITTRDNLDSQINLLQQQLNAVKKSKGVRR